MTHVVLSLGSNIDPDKNIRFAIEKITEQFGVTELSPVYKTASVGFEGHAFLNLVLGFYSAEQLLKIRDKLRGIEILAGRIRGKKSFADRILDIDVVLFGNHYLQLEGFNIPRDEIEKYAYVLKPLSDLYPDLIHPVTGLTYESMWKNFDSSAQILSKIDFFK